MFEPRPRSEISFNELFIAERRYHSTKFQQPCVRVFLHRDYENVRLWLGFVRASERGAHKLVRAFNFTRNGRTRV